MDSQSVAARIRVLREARGWTRLQLAEALGWDGHESVRRVETGRGGAISVDTVAAVAAALEVSVGDVLANPDDAPVIESVVTVTRHYCERCQGKRGEVESYVRTDLAALDGVIGINRGMAAQALVLATAMDECPDPTKLATLSRELRMVMDALMQRVTPADTSKRKVTSVAGGGNAGFDLSSLGVPVISS